LQYINVVIKKMKRSSSTIALPTKNDIGKKNIKKLNIICLSKLRYFILTL